VRLSSPSVLLLTLWTSFAAHAAAASGTGDVQTHLRIGVVNGTFTGSADGSFNVPSSIEGEGEYLYGNRFSSFARATLSLESSSGQFKYIFMGLGQRYYLFSRSGAIESDHEGVLVEIRPRMRYFIEGVLGISQVQIKAVTSTLIAQSTLLEYGAGAGLIYQISKTIGIEGNLGIAKGFAVSSVSVDALIVRGLLGVAVIF
jgi:hypothetical protein